MKRTERTGRVGRLLWVAALLVLAIVAGCAQQSDPSEAVTAYFRAAVAGDADQLRVLSCAEWEDEAARQAQSFRTVKAELKDMSCTRGGEDGQFTLVSCTGAIEMDYDGELREFPLETYRVVQEDDEWRFCGEG